MFRSLIWLAGHGAFWIALPTASSSATMWRSVAHKAL
jgi:hypothetical protein